MSLAERQQILEEGRRLEPLCADVSSKEAKAVLSRLRKLTTSAKEFRLGVYVRGDLANLVKLVLSLGVSPETFWGDGDYLKPVLSHAAGTGSTRSLKVLLDAGARVNVDDARGWSALHLAAGTGMTACIRLLVGVCLPAVYFETLTLLFRGWSGPGEEDGHRRRVDGPLARCNQRPV